MITRTYRLTADDEAAIAAAEDSRRSKKAKHASDENKLGSGGVYSFHAEDEVLQKVRLSECFRFYSMLMKYYSMRFSLMTLALLTNNHETKTLSDLTSRLE
jgi:hypothetical protein